MSGAILVVDKAIGPTSHDVVDAVRAITGERRVGHAGTLDPLASGVLVVLVGAATRLAEYLTAHDKRYHATIRLGARSATDDAEGPITDERPVDVTRERVAAALDSFRGEIAQRPPAFAAVKQDGVRAYQRARRGEAVEIAARKVTIHAIEIVAFAPPLLEIDVRCGAGTYIRALARDVGAALGCGAYLAALRRTASGPFSIDRSSPLSSLSGETWRVRALPIESGIASWPRVDLDADAERRVRNGLTLVAPDPEPAADLLRAHAADGRLVAVLRFDRATRTLRPEKVFAETS